MLSFPKLVQDTFDQHNLLRSNPSSFIPDLEALLPLFKGQVLHKPNEIPLRTNEGPSAIKECIQFLRSQKPLPGLQWVPEMAQAAQDHAEDIGPKGIVGHSGSNGSTMSSRLEKYGDWESCVGENIDFGGRNGREVVCNLIVDDGNIGRGHRKNIFNPNYRSAGVGAQRHTAYKTCIVIDYAGGYTKKGNNSQKEYRPFEGKGIGDYGKMGDFNKPGYNFEKKGDYGKMDDFNKPYNFEKKGDYGKMEDFNKPGYNFEKKGDYGKMGEFSDVKDMFLNRFKDVPEVSTVFSENSSNQPAKFTYTYKTSNQPPITTTNTSNNYEDFSKNYKIDNFAKDNKMDFGSFSKKEESFQDKDKPFDAVGTRVTRNITITNGKKCTVEKKIYTLKDGSTKIVENKIIE